MNNFNDSWKNKEVFDLQLDFNLKELESKSTYPSHWVDNIDLMSKYNPKSILDVGCGCGTFYEVCRREFPDIKYFGTDYAKEAIELAKTTWGDYFQVLDYKNLTKEMVKQYDLLYLSAVLDVLPNGDEAFEFILSLEPKQILVSRVKLTDGDSKCETIKAYNNRPYYAYYHNITNFFNIIKKYNYEVVDERSRHNFYLIKNNE